MRRVTFSRISTIAWILALAWALLLAGGGPVDARKGGYRPPYAGIVVDAKTGKVLYADSADALRHPASITKVMTLYLLFDELERGTLTLQTPLKVSAEAARQPPSKVGLKPGQTIPVETAIKLLVTKSANDVAVAVAENISGSEAKFAERMTRKARSLGMRSTVYRNASGLPDDEQVTTARDLALLGRAIQDNHPKYYDYFATRSASWGGHTYRSHNRLLGEKGVDGIKTGYIRASGFNLLTAAKDNGREVVAVVLGGRSGASRDAHMRDLIARYMPKASKGARTAPLIAEAPIPAEPPPVLGRGTAVAANVPVPQPRPDDPDNSTEEPIDLPEPVMAAMAASAPPPVETPSVQTEAKADAPVNTATMTPGSIAQRIETANRLATATTTTTPAQDMRWVVGAPAIATAYAGTTPGSPRSQPQAQQAIAAAIAPAQPVVTPTAAAANPVEAGLIPAGPLHPALSVRASAGTPVPAAAAPEAAPQPQLAAAPAKPESKDEGGKFAGPPLPGWQIQIAATPDRAQAKELLDRVSRAVKAVDRSVEPFTEPVQKDGVTLYRARFAGFSERSAAAACKAVKKSSMSCFTLKN